MDLKKQSISFWILLTISGLTSCQGQTKKNIGGTCEGCEAIYEYQNKTLTPVDTLPKFRQNKPQLKVTGNVFKKDGKTPAENVIVYIYHTNRQGIYETRGHETGWAKRHGFFRGWVKTGKNGQYTFYTFRPAAYSDGSEPEHIHITIKEPDKNEYYLDEYLFDDDPSLTKAMRKKQPGRGGSGIVKPYLQDGLMTIRRDIILGKNIPDYP
ncbi:dioxygenase family protein [Chryseobacterium arthrosphaerae]|uniref:dioxygenase family protein n=1 Tax=Chryseobacterium arthrosphaerae TaxID=651561 RepID=UPI003D34A6EC